MSLGADPKGHIPTRLDRWLLVRYKKFPTAEEIPKTVSAITMRAVHDRARVHCSFLIMGVCGILMFGNALHGRYLSKHGHSVERNNYLNQQAYNKRKEMELAAAAAPTDKH